MVDVEPLRIGLEPDDAAVLDYYGETPAPARLTLGACGTYRLDGEVYLVLRTTHTVVAVYLECTFRDAYGDTLTGMWPLEVAEWPEVWVHEAPA